MADKRICRKWSLFAAAFLMLLFSVGCSVGRSVGRDVRYKVSAAVGNYGFPRKPNVILVVSGGQGYGDMGCHGNGVVKTPNIDRFYKQSSHFGKFFVSPLDKSTRGSLLTGRNVPLGGELSQEDVSLTEVLGGAGYKTCTEVFFDEAIRFIAENRDDPFFCYLSINTTGQSNVVDKKYSAPYLKQGFNEEVANFYGAITSFDKKFGHLLSRVQGFGLLGNTLIIFMTGSGSAMADNEGLFNAGFRGGKGSVYEGGSRGASFWRMPGTIKPNRTIEQMAMHYDIIPTLMSICDAEHPEPEKLEGINLIPYLMNPKQKEKDRSFVTFGKNGDYSVRTSRFRLVNGMELYDVNANSSETTNVIERYPAETVQIKAVYDR